MVSCRSQSQSWYLLCLSPFVMPIQTLSSTNNPVSSFFSSISSSPGSYLASLYSWQLWWQGKHYTVWVRAPVLAWPVPPSTAAILLMINSPLVPRGLTPLDQNTVKHSQKISSDLPSSSFNHIWLYSKEYSPNLGSYSSSIIISSLWASLPHGHWPDRCQTETGQWRVPPPPPRHWCSQHPDDSGETQGHGTSYKMMIALSICHSVLWASSS